MAVVTAGSLIRVACPFTGDQDRLAAAIDAMLPSDGTTRVAEAVTLARRMLAEKRNPRIMVVSDGGFPEAALAAAEDVQLHVVQGAGRNVGITAVGEPVATARSAATHRGAQMRRRTLPRPPRRS